MKKPLGGAEAKAARNRLLRGLLILLGYSIAAWLALSRVAGELLHTQAAFEFALDSVTTGSLRLLLGGFVAVGIYWNYVLLRTAGRVWGWLSGLGALGAVFALATASNGFSSLILWGVLLAVIWPAARRAPAMASSVAVDRVAGVIGRGVVLILGVVTFGLPVVASCFAAYALWTGTGTSEWHWAVKIPAAAVLGVAAHLLASMVVMLVMAPITNSLRGRD